MRKIFFGLLVLSLCLVGCSSKTTTVYTKSDSGYYAVKITLESTENKLSTINFSTNTKTKQSSSVLKSYKKSFNYLKNTYGKYKGVALTYKIKNDKFYQYVDIDMEKISAKNAYIFAMAKQTKTGYKKLTLKEAKGYFKAQGYKLSKD